MMKNYSNNTSTKKKSSKWWNDLENLFTIIICIFILGSAYNIHIVQLHEQQEIDFSYRRQNHYNQWRMRMEKDNQVHGRKKNKTGRMKNHSKNQHSHHHKNFKMFEFTNHRHDLKITRKNKSNPTFGSQSNQKQRKTQKSYELHDDILKTIEEQKLRPYSAESVWEDLIKQGQTIMERTNYSNHLTVIEVGAQNENQSLLAAQAKYHVHCVEPSPKSFKNIHESMKKKLRLAKDDESKQYLHFYNVAAGDVSGKTLDFYSTGGTGDHVGEYDMWNMKPGKMPDDWPEEKRGKMIQVPSVQLDDIIYDNKVEPTVVNGFDSKPEKIDTVYALKVDTQGFEPSVFAGLKKSINEHKIQYIMTEYWPKGMGLMANRMDNPCEVAVKVFDILTDAGYKLYALPMQGHPSAWSFSKTIFHHVANWHKRPLDDYRADCKHILNFENEFPNPDYHMGYWSDVLAIAPGTDPFIPKKKPKKVEN